MPGPKSYWNLEVYHYIKQYVYPSVAHQGPPMADWYLFHEIGYKN